MPKTKPVGTKTLYCYTTAENRAFALKKAKKEKIKGGYSGYINKLLTREREKSKAA